MNILQAIGVINRRIATTAKLFGTSSYQYERLTSIIDEKTAYRGLYMNKNNVLQLSTGKAVRSNYRKLIPAAKEIQKTPVQILKRQAKKLEEQRANDDFFEDTEIKDNATYYKWLSTFDTYFESCYTLAKMEGYTGGAETYRRAKELYDDANDYNKTWNYFYKTGAFKEFETAKASYDTQQAQQDKEQENPQNYTYNDEGQLIDIITGEVLE